MSVASRRMMKSAGSIDVKVHVEHARIVRNDRQRACYHGRLYGVGETKSGVVKMLFEDEDDKREHVVRIIAAVCACDEDTRPDDAKFTAVANLEKYKQCAHGQPVFWLRLKVLRFTVAADAPAKKHKHATIAGVAPVAPPAGSDPQFRKKI